jgi:hypothetical protein
VLCLAAAPKLPSRRRRCQATIPGALSGTKRIQSRHYTYTTHLRLWNYLSISIVFIYIATPLQRSRSYSHIIFLFNAAFHDHLSTIIFYSGTLHATLFPPFLVLFILIAYSFFLHHYISFLPLFQLLYCFLYLLSFTLISMTCIELFFINLFFFFPSFFW